MTMSKQKVTTILNGIALLLAFLSVVGFFMPLLKNWENPTDNFVSLVGNNWYIKSNGVYLILSLVFSLIAAFVFLASLKKPKASVAGGIFSLLTTIMISSAFSGDAPYYYDSFKECLASGYDMIITCSIFAIIFAVSSLLVIVFMKENATSKEATDVIFCTVCGAKNSSTNAFCVSCGKAFLKAPVTNTHAYEQPSVQTVFCTACGATNSAANAFCANCGAPIEKPEAVKWQIQ